MMRRLMLVLLLFSALDVFARIGGGESYSGSSSSDSSYDSSSDSDSSSSYDYDSGSSGSGSGGGGSSDSGAVIAVFMVIGFFVFIAGASAREMPSVIQVTAPAASARTTDLSALRKYDPNFSEIVFTDFCYSLFTRLYEALGRGRLDDFAPYVSAAVRDG
ncbi:MAG TPA: hypothetical protein VHK90_02925, partial [Thermoanaerobaculia bacterium]|nr:hypothetical protein [Thermoanaerobaculia bacterium]